MYRNFLMSKENFTEFLEHLKNEGYDIFDFGGNLTHSSVKSYNKPNYLFHARSHIILVETMNSINTKRHLLFHKKLFNMKDSK